MAWPAADTEEKREVAPRTKPLRSSRQTKPKIKTSFGSRHGRCCGAMSPKVVAFDGTAGLPST